MNRCSQTSGVITQEHHSLDKLRFRTENGCRILCAMCVPGLKTAAWVSVHCVPLLAVLGIQGHTPEWLMQHVGGNAWFLIVAHSWPCRLGPAPLDPFVHLHCPLWALGLGGIIISSNSVSKNKKMVKELDHCSCSDDSAASKMVVWSHLKV